MKGAELVGAFSDLLVCYLGGGDGFLATLDYDGIQVVVVAVDPLKIKTK